MPLSEMSMTNITSTFRSTGAIHSYLLGESAKNIVLRLTLILTAILSIWSCMIAVSIIRTRYRRRKQTLKSSHNLHHLNFESRQSVAMTNSATRGDRLDSSSTRKANVFERILPSIKRPVRQETVAYRSVLKKEQRHPSDPAKIHAVIEAMTRRSFTSSHRESLLETPSSFSEEPSRDRQLKLKTSLRTVHTLSPPLSSRHASTSFVGDSPHPHPSNINIRAVCLLQSLTRRFSNIDTKSPLSSITDRPRPNRSLLSASSVVDLSSNKGWNWQYPRPIADEVLLASSQRHLPLVMVTDTNRSYTNIVELDTFEDKNRVTTDMEKRLRRQLETFHRPRYST